MAKLSTWPVVHAERTALAADLAAIGDERWATPSLCAEWTVRDVLAHMTATARITPAGFFPRLAAAGLSFRRLQAKDIATERGASPADTLARFESIVTSVRHPPGPPDTILGETIVHSEDIRRPLGLRHDHPIESVVRVADFYKKSNLLIGSKRRIAGVSLQASDTDWSHGTGPEARGPILAILLVMTGRRAALDDLSGPGVAELQTRS